MKILIVDDNKENRQLLEALLKGNGYQVAWASNGTEAIDRLRSEPFDMIISDILMPVMDGFRLCREVKGDDRLKQIPFVFYTATYTDLRDEELALRVGADRFIRKPIDPDEFIKIIGEVIEEAEKGRIVPRTPDFKDEREIYKLYDERLVKKLEKKLLELEREIEKRKRAEEALKASEEKYRDIFNNIRDIFYRTDNEGRIQVISPSVKEVFGYDPEEIMGEKLSDYYVNPGQREEFLALLREKGEVRAYEAPMRAKDGSIVWVSTHAHFFKDKDGNTRGVQGASRDITESKREEEKKKRLEAQLQQSQKMEAIGTLAGGIAHDFNNVLTVIMGNAEIALMRVKKDDPLYENIEEIEKTGQRAAHLIRQILAFSRRQVIQPEVLDLNDTVRKTENILGRLIGEHIELEMILDPRLRPVEVDHGQIEQVIINLAVNARDAMPGGGKLILETGNLFLPEKKADQDEEIQPGAYVMLTVRDTGIGMDEETRSHVFEPFFTTKEVGRGTGMGLATVFGIIKQSKGHIHVESEPGKGTTFRIYLPHYEGERAIKREVKAEREQLVGSETVMVVEDDERVRSLAYRVLSRYGYAVLEAENADVALKISKGHEGPINLVLTDVIMPGGNVREMAAQIQSQRKETKVIYMSGHTDETISHYGVLEPGIEFLEKPFTAEALARKVREVLDK